MTVCSESWIVSTELAALVIKNYFIRWWAACLFLSPEDSVMWAYLCIREAVYFLYLPSVSRCCQGEKSFKMFLNLLHNREHINRLFSCVQSSSLINPTSQKVMMCVSKALAHTLSLCSLCAWGGHSQLKQSCHALSGMSKWVTCFCGSVIHQRGVLI